MKPPPDTTGVRDLVLGGARDRARAIAAAAAADAEAVRAEARNAAAELIGRARAEAEAAAAARLELIERRAQRSASRRVREAESDLEAQLRLRCRSAALALRDDAIYPSLLRALTHLAQHILGDDADVDDVAGAGGVRATAGSRSLDLTLVGLADLAREAQLEKPTPAPVRAVAS